MKAWKTTSPTSTAPMARRFPRLQPADAAPVARPGDQAAHPVAQAVVAEIVALAGEAVPAAGAVAAEGVPVAQAVPAARPATAAATAKTF